VAAECARAGEWLEEHKKALASASKMAMPPVLLRALSSFCPCVRVCKHVERAAETKKKSKEARQGDGRS
jgi:hypothetical protein